MDPSELFKKLKKDGKPLAVGEQEDVADFSELFLKTLSRAAQVMQSKDVDIIKEYSLSSPLML